ncbi:MAG: hypothetical protein JWR88_1154, partial [Pseudonocardia sp.]|nr:hypothetical protein [Pseudonocardia sp.]
VADTYNLGGDQIVHLPAPPPVPPGSPAAVYETVVNNYQQNIVNDNSTTVNQIFNNNGDVNVNQAVAGAGGIANTGTIDDSILNTGTQNIDHSNVAVGNDGSNVNQTGDVHASDGSAVNTGQGTAETTGSGIHFGAGAQGNVNAASHSSDVNQNANQSQVDITGQGGAGGAGGDGGYGDGGAGGAGGDGIEHSPIHVDVDQHNEQDVTHHDAPTHDAPPDVHPIL